MKKFILLLCLIGLTVQLPSHAHPNNQLHHELSEQLLQHLYIPARLIDEDSISLEIHFSIDEHAQITAAKVIGGDPLLRRFVQQQIQSFQSTLDLRAGCNQQFVLPVKIRK